jgi:hypothetical protein
MKGNYMLLFTAITLAISFVLIFVFHIFVFILFLFLPFFGLFRGKHGKRKTKQGI